MKFLSILTLTVFLNFMALPSLATIFNWDIATTNIVISEEETTHSPLVINEKTLPTKLNVHDFVKFFEYEKEGKSFIQTDDSIHSSPHLLIFSPPPNV
jgi:hypothetical protein